MPKVFKQNQVICTEGVVRIPDIPDPVPPPSPDAQEEEILEVQEGQTVERQEAALLDAARSRAEEISQKLLQAARAEREKLLEGAQAEAFQIRSQARQEGYQSAYTELKSQIESCLAKVGSMMDRMQNEQEQYFEKYAKELRFLALEIAGKVLDKRIAEDDEELMDLVRQAVSSVKNAEWISVEISENLPGLVSRLSEEFSDKAYGNKVEVQTRDIPSGSCIIHTPDGVVDASVETQLENLKGIFSSQEEGNKEGLV